MSAFELQGPKSTFRRLLRLAVTVFLNIAILIQLLVIAVGSQEVYIFGLHSPAIHISGTFDSTTTVLFIGEPTGDWDAFLFTDPAFSESRPSWMGFSEDPNGYCLLWNWLFASVDGTWVMAFLNRRNLVLVLVFAAIHHRRLIARLIRRRPDPTDSIH